MIYIVANERIYKNTSAAERKKSITSYPCFLPIGKIEKKRHLSINQSIHMLYQIKRQKERRTYEIDRPMSFYIGKIAFSP